MSVAIDYRTDADIIDRWHLLCLEWGKGSRGGIPGGLTKQDAVEYSRSAWTKVEAALCNLAQAQIERPFRLLRTFYLCEHMCGETTGEQALGEWLTWHYKSTFNNAPDGMTNDQRARVWLDRALLMLDGFDKGPRGV